MPRVLASFIELGIHKINDLLCWENESCSQIPKKSHFSAKSHPCQLKSNAYFRSFNPSDSSKHNSPYPPEFTIKIVELYTFFGLPRDYIVYAMKNNAFATLTHRDTFFFPFPCFSALTRIHFFLTHTTLADFLQNTKNKIGAFYRSAFRPAQQSPLRSLPPQILNMT